MTVLFEDYRKARSVRLGWEIRTEGGDWLRVTGWFKWTSTDPAKPDVIGLTLADGTECHAYADDVIMTRRLP